MCVCVCVGGCVCGCMCMHVFMQTYMGIPFCVLACNPRLMLSRTESGYVPSGS